MTPDVLVRHGRGPALLALLLLGMASGAPAAVRATPEGSSEPDGSSGPSPEPKAGEETRAPGPPAPLPRKRPQPTGTSPSGELSEEEELRALEREGGEDSEDSTKPGASAARPILRRSAKKRFHRFIQSMNPEVSAIAILAASYFYDHGLRGQGNVVPQGGHDPGKTGFHLQVFELALQAEIDPYFRMDAFLVVTLSGIEFHEGYVTTLGLPGGLQLKAGKLNHRFGRHNLKHLHDWAFADTMIPAARLLSKEHFASLAVETSWMMPLPWYSLLSLALSMPTGSDLASFVGDGSRRSGFHIKDPRHLLYVAHLAQFFELSGSWSLSAGLSYAIGANNSGGYDLNMTQLFGADLFLKYRPLNRSYSEIQLTAEWYGRLMQIPEDQAFDWGLYAQASFRLAKRWFLALRYDMVEIGDARKLVAFDFAEPTTNPEHPNPLDDQHRGSVSVSWQPTHFSQLRLQYNNNWTRRSTDAWEPTAFKLSHEVILQLQGNIGAHGAHQY